MVKDTRPSLDPAMDTENLTILNIAFEPDHVVITFTRQEEVRLHEGSHLMVLGHQLTLSRDAPAVEGIDSVESDIKDLVLDSALRFAKAPSVADVQASAAERDEDDDDEFRGMGE